MDLISTRRRTVIVSKDPDTLARKLYEETPNSLLVLNDSSSQLTYLRDTVIEEICFSLEQRGVEPENMILRAKEVMDRLGISHLAEHNPSRLSSGQTKRVAFASVAVILEGTIILDDPFTGLDEPSMNCVRHLLRDYPGDIITVLSNPRPADLNAEWFEEHDGELVKKDNFSEVPPIPAPVPAGAEQEPLLSREVQAQRMPQSRKWWQFKAKHTAYFTSEPVHLEAHSGVVTWLSGPNGSGKTTILRSLAGLDGHDRTDGFGLALQRPSEQVIDSTMEEFVRDGELLSFLGVSPEEHPLDIPRAQLRLAQVGSLLRSEASVVALDEPDADLGTETRGQFFVLLREALVSGKAVILTCHNRDVMKEIAQFAAVNEVAIMPKGHNRRDA